MPPSPSDRNHASSYRFAEIERRLGLLEERHQRSLERVRDGEEETRRLRELCDEWGPVIDAARDQQYLRDFLERQERRERERDERDAAAAQRGFTHRHAWAAIACASILSVAAIVVPLFVK